MKLSIGREDGLLRLLLVKYIIIRIISRIIKNPVKNHFRLNRTVLPKVLMIEQSSLILKKTVVNNIIHIRDILTVVTE